VQKIEPGVEKKHKGDTPNREPKGEQIVSEGRFLKKPTELFNKRRSFLLAGANGKDADTAIWGLRNDITALRMGSWGGQGRLVNKAEKLEVHLK